MNKYILYIFPLFGLLILGFTGCEEPKQNVAGIEVTNGISGVVKDNDQPSPGAIVTFFPDDHNPVTSNEIIPTTIANDEGEYFIKLEKRGIYNIEFWNSKREKAEIKKDLEIDPDKDYQFDADLIHTSTLAIEFEGDINTGEYFYIPGTSTFYWVKERDIVADILHITFIPVQNNTALILSEDAPSYFISDLNFTENDTIRVGKISDSTFHIENLINPDTSEADKDGVDSSDTPDTSGVDTIGNPIDTTNNDSTIPVDTSTIDTTGSDSTGIDTTANPDTTGTPDTTGLDTSGADTTGVPDSSVIDSLINANCPYLNPDTFAVFLDSLDNIAPSPPPDTPCVETQNFWRHFQDLKIQPSIGGNNIINNDLHNFPVLVRIDSSNFDFSQSKPNGEDIRFHKQNGLNVNYEIELWDNINKKAVIWLHIDTLFANQENKQVTMVWGNPEAPSHSNGPATFNNSNLNLGVWHLDEATGPFYESAIDNFGISIISRPQVSIGVIGNSQYFNSIEDEITSDKSVSLNLGSSITLSAWINPDIAGGNQGGIISSKSDGTGKYNYQLIHDGGYILFQYHKNDDGNLVIYKPDIESITSSDIWIHVALTYVYGQKSFTAMYINGALVPGQWNITEGEFKPKADPMPISIGNTAGKNFSGKIDEARISSSYRSADWIKMSYESQKPGSALIEIIKGK